MLSSHLLIVLVELPVRLHSIGNANSKIRIVSTLLNMSLYCKIQFISALERLILMYCFHFCKVLKKKGKKKEKALVRRGSFSPEFSLELSSSWASTLKYPHFLLLSVWSLWDVMPELSPALSPERITGVLALCANTDQFGFSSPCQLQCLEHSPAKLTEDRPRSRVSYSHSYLGDNLPLHSVLIHTLLL